MGEQDLKKPEPPEPHECCAGGSCCPCVWDTYYAEMREWQAQQGQIPTINKPTPDPDRSTYR